MVGSKIDLNLVIMVDMKRVSRTFHILVVVLLECIGLRLSGLISMQKREKIF